ncbi:MAG: T9SS type A sorting domain-containing protein, partial [Candidatus Cloacimonetes bacterium]|nr:T9SS type A sorting domain-containing protein [Candidatus Cloacimonadota bacterium]
NPSDVSLTITRTSQVVDVDVDCFENTVTIIPNIASYWLENETLEAEVSGLQDLYSNIMEATVSWEFYVNTNPVHWNITKLDVIKPLGESMTLTAELINSGGLYYSYVFTDYADSLYHPELEYHCPDWLSISPASGQLIPMDTQEIQFEISDQIGFGHYETTIYAHTSMGNEAIIIEVDVLSNPPEWATDPIGNFDFSMTITGQLSIDNEISSDINDVIGAFIINENDEYECRGYAHKELIPYFDDTYQFFLTIHSNTAYGEEIIFRTWDASECKEHYGIDEEFTFLAGAVYGTPVNPNTIHVSSQLIQTIPCNNDWNWISMNISNDQTMAIDSVLASLSPSDNDLIKNQTDYAQFTSGLGWVGSLDTLNTTEMYKIKLAQEDGLQLIGNLEDPYQATISLSSGWNWIGYIPHVCMSVNQALSNISNPITGDQIKNQNDFAQYIEENSAWFGSLLFMNPGEGYMLKVDSSGTFNYPDYVIGTPPPNFVLDDKSISPKDSIVWNVNPHDYEYSSNITSVIYENSELLNSENVLLGAFCGSECRGIAAPKYIDELDEWMYFLTIYSNTIGEPISFKVYFEDTGKIAVADETIMFMCNQILGKALDPFIINISTTGTIAAPGNALDYDGDNDYVEVADNDNLDLTNNYTIEAWIYPNAFNSLGGIVSKCQTYGSDGYTLRLNSEEPYTGLNFDGMETSTGILSANHWYHLAAVNDNGTRKLYLNGVEQTLNGSAFTVLSNSNPILLGSDYNSCYFSGKIDEVRIWKDVRTEQEIRENIHQTLSGTETDLVSYWQFNEYSGITTADIIGGNNGTLYNMDDDDWVASTVSIGGGSSNSIISFTNGTVNLGHVSIQTTNSFNNPVDIYCTEISRAPNMTSGISGTTLSDRYWVIDVFGTPGTFSTNLTFTLPSGYLDPNDTYLKLYRRNSNSDGIWSQLICTLGNVTETTVEFTGITSFCQFTIGSDGSSTLPVELSAFNALYESANEFVTVNWTTASETDVQGFNIYRSEYNDLSMVGNHINASIISGHGNSSNPHSYSFEDITANILIPNYYWLEVVDYGGVSQYHGPVKYVPGDIDGDQEPDVYKITKLYSNYPNPVINFTTIKYQLKGSVLEQNATIKLYDIRGRCVKTTKGVNGKVELDVSDLCSGIYYYQLNTSSYNKVKKMVVAK